MHGRLRKLYFSFILNTSVSSLRIPKINPDPPVPNNLPPIIPSSCKETYILSTAGVDTRGDIFFLFSQDSPKHSAIPSIFSYSKSS